MADATLIFYFTTRVGPQKKQIPLPVSPSLSFIDVIDEVCKKFGVAMQSLSIATPTGLVLTHTDIMQSASLVANSFGTHFEIIDQGIVGIGRPQ